MVEPKLRMLTDFTLRKNSTDVMSALRVLMDKYKEGQKELHCVFMDQEKAHYRVTRDELWYCMKKSGVAEKFMRVVENMYETVVQ